MPMVDLIAHRFFYIIKDTKTKTRRALLLPFLHERQILLRSMATNKKYFSTIVNWKEISPKDG
jgi:hypothetical protein